MILVFLLHKHYITIFGGIASILRNTKIVFKNSTDLTNKLKDFTLEENSILYSFNVVSMYSNCNMKKRWDILRIKLPKHFDLIQDVTMASLEIEFIMKLVIPANEYFLYFGFRGEFYKQVFVSAMRVSLSLLCWQISSWTLLKPLLYTDLGCPIVSGTDSWRMWFAFGNTV